MEVHRRSLAIIALVALAVAVLGVMAASEGSQGQISTIDVDLDPSVRDLTARPTDTENDLLEFDGCLTLNREPFWPPGSSVVIDLGLRMVGVGEVWAVSFDPPSLTFTASESKAFSATVTVPVGLAAAAFYTLEFTASTEDLLVVEVTSDTARVTIAQYYKISRQYSTQPITVKQGELVEFNFTVENRGNGDDTFLFEVANLMELEGAGLTVLYETSKRVRPGHTAGVKLQVEAADDALESQFQLNVTITSEGSEGDPAYQRAVTSGAEWTIVVEPSLGSTITQNIVSIVAAVVVLVVVAVVLVLLRRRRRARDEEEDLEEEEPPPARKKRKGRPPVEEEGDAEDEYLDE